jgi:hypothetical protein
MTAAQLSLPASAERLLAELAGRSGHSAGSRHRRKTSPVRRARDLERLLAAGLIAPQEAASGGGQQTSSPGYDLTAEGRAYLLRRSAARNRPQDSFRGQHLVLVRRKLAPGQEPLLVNAAESPVAWLGQRGLLAPEQLQAAERLRADYTRAQLLPHVSLNWGAPVVDAPRGTTGLPLTEAVVAARQRVGRALAAVGREFAGLLVDVCCFLKPLSQVEHERRWPPRSGKVVLGLALAALARHYGLSGTARGRGRAEVRVWFAADPEVEPETVAVSGPAAVSD